jgi:hypothetical protein
MITCLELAEYLRLSAARSQALLSEVVEAVVVSGAEKAKGYIGTQQSGWEALHEGTLEGFRHMNGRWIYGKNDLGYSPPNNDLLREGDMRDSIEGLLTAPLIGEIGSPDKVALWQELGTDGAEYPIPPRPFLSKALVMMIPEANVLLEELAVNLLVPGRL